MNEFVNIKFSVSPSKTSTLEKRETNQSITLASKQLQIWKFTLFIAHPPRSNTISHHNPPIRNPPTVNINVGQLAFEKSRRSLESACRYRFSLSSSPPRLSFDVYPITAESRGWIFLTQFPWRTWPWISTRIAHLLLFEFRASRRHGPVRTMHEIVPCIAMHVGKPATRPSWYSCCAIRTKERRNSPRNERSYMTQIQVNENDRDEYDITWFVVRAMQRWNYWNFRAIRDNSSKLCRIMVAEYGMERIGVFIELWLMPGKLK